MAMEVHCASPEKLAPEHISREYRVADARDAVVVVRFKDGGLISYRKPDGRFLHTLNTEEGFQRKLEQLGIRVDNG